MGCSLLSRPYISEKLLYKTLQNWQEFQFEGIIEVNYNNLALRKNIMIRKNLASFRIDIFDTGIMGLNPKPYFSMYMDSVVVVRPPFSEDVLTSSEAGLKDFELASCLFELNKLETYKSTIIHSQKIDLSNLKIYFSDKMQIYKIELGSSPYIINFSYYEALDEIFVLQDKKEIANIKIDKIKHNNIEIPILK